jgi:hypothetical protein
MYVCMDICITLMHQALMPFLSQAGAENGVGEADQQSACSSLGSKASARAWCDGSWHEQASDEVQELTAVRSAVLHAVASCRMQMPDT